ncbi:MAG: 16S rRNA (guanine(527)-N(7))-methyltransferase RsmG [Clostridiales bacterium]|nr:16S rRNA (guanine(527)-N(7))-methyltransferase RsmG [Clostridiales bacterium]
MDEMNEALLVSEMPGLNEDQIRQFINYYNMLIDWNSRMNLTRITEPNEVARKHFADSVLGASLLKQNARVVDVGTGAGFPGIPLKIVRPDIELVLVDSLAKRINFLKEACSAVGIEAAAVHARAEDAARDPKLRESFDVALSRAVAPMNVLLELTVPFIKVGGCSLMYKAASVDEELGAASSALRILNCRAEVRSFDVSWGTRSIVSAVKLKKTDGKYPRKAGSVEKNPL